MDEAERVSVLLDTDIGDDIDDAFALAACLRHPGLELRGVATVRGDTTLRAAQARYLAALAGSPGLPVAAGTRDPLDAQAPLEPNCQAGVLPAAEEATWREGREDGVRMLAELAEAHPGITLLAIGPLTNVARLALEFPEAYARLGRLAIMGGHMLPEREGAEWNFACDPRAAQVVLGSGKPILLVGLDVTLQCQMTAEELQNFLRSETPLALAVGEMTRLWQGGCQGYCPEALPVQHDPLAALALAEPDLIRTEPRRIRVDEAGRCVGDSEGSAIEFAVEVDARRMLGRLLEVIG